MICVAHLIRDVTDSRAVYRMPDKFSDVEYWQIKYGDDWCDVHYRQLDAYVAINVGFQWDVDNIEFFESLEQFEAEFVDCDFLEEMNDEG